MLQKIVYVEPELLKLENTVLTPSKLMADFISLVLVDNGLPKKQVSGDF